MESRKIKLCVAETNPLGLILVPSGMSALSPREQEVLGLIAKGMIYKEIGVELKIGAETVRTHVQNICKKMRVRSRIEAVAKYYSNAISG